MKKYRFKRGKMDEKKYQRCSACGGGIYFFGFIGAAIYYVQQSATFWQGILGILKAFIWPVFVVYHLLGM
jgi:hypothetical protein